MWYSCIVVGTKFQNEPYEKSKEIINFCAFNCCN